MVKVLINIFLIFHHFFLLAQVEIDEKFNFYDPAIKLYVIGEDHWQENSELQIKVIHYLLEKQKIDKIILEIPQEIAEIVDNYVKNGEDKSINDLYKLFAKKIGANMKKLVENIREYNLSNHDSVRIEIKGLDFLSFDLYQNQIKALSLIFPELQYCNTPLIKRYFFTEKTANYCRSKAKKVIDSLINDVVEHSQLYIFCLGKRFELFEEQLNQLTYNYLSFKKFDSLREPFMSKKLIETIESSNLCVLICGASHALVLKNDSWFYGISPISMVAEAKIKYPKQVFSIITQYYDRKLIHIFPEFNLLKNPNSIYFKNNKKQYKIIIGEELKLHPEADKRCNMIIIQNTKFIKK